jgi:hypothetical protein
MHDSFRYPFVVEFHDLRGISYSKVGCLKISGRYWHLLTPFNCT